MRGYSTSPVRWVGLGLTVIGTGLFLATSAPLHQKAPAVDPWAPELNLVLPPPVATLLAAGDPYLAANLQVIRGSVVATHLESPGQKRLFGRLLESASRLNPAHEDGYYLGQAILPWAGQVARNQRIQKRAEAARPWDWLPSFFRAFNLYYFRKKPAEAAPILGKAADRASPRNRESLLALAAQWTSLGYQPKQALKVVRQLAAGAGPGPLRRHLAARQKQLRGLMRLQKAAAAFRKEEGRPPRSFEALIGYGGLQQIPDDPLGEGFRLDARGEVSVKPPRALKQDPGLPEDLK